MTFRCPVCLLESEDMACDVCGRHLTARDLVEGGRQEPEASSVPDTRSEEEAA